MKNASSSLVLSCLANTNTGLFPERCFAGERGVLKL
jgi:hypothetical protein